MYIWTFFQFKIMSLRRDDLMATDMGKLQNKEIILLPIFLRKRCIKRHFQGIHDRFFINTEFRASQLKHDPTEKVCIQMDELAQTDFSYHMTHAKYFERIGGSLWTILGKLDRWEIVQTSTKRWPHQTVNTENLEKDNSSQCHSGSIKTGTNDRVLPPIGGNGVIPGGAHDDKKKVHKRAYVQSMIERGDPFCSVFG